jgi:hypothetical protein
MSFTYLGQSFLALTLCLALYLVHGIAHMERMSSSTTRANGSMTMHIPK